MTDPAPNPDTDAGLPESDEDQFDRFMDAVRGDVELLSPPGPAADPPIVFPDQGSEEFPQGRLNQKYVISSRIDTGSFGAVFEAFNTELKRPEAIKVLKVGDKRGQEEAIRAAGIKSDSVPHIYEVHEPSQDFDRSWFAMELVRGKSLRHILKGRMPCSEKTVIAIGCRVAECLRDIHRADIVHRDLKPANILTERRGGEDQVESETADKHIPNSATTTERAIIFDNNLRVCLADFGMSASAERDALQASGGTPEYMSPEQVVLAGGSEHSYGIRQPSDVFSLGVILYEIATGVRPFGRPPSESTEDSRNNRKELYRHIREVDPTPPRQINGQLSSDLEAVILMCLRKDPQARYADGADVLNELTRIKNGYPVVARPVNAPIRFWKLCRRNPWLCGLTLSLFLGTVVSTVFAIEAFEQARIAQLQTNRALNFLGIANLRRDAAQGTAVRLAVATAQRLAENNDYHSAAVTFGTALALATSAREKNAAAAVPDIETNGGFATVGSEFSSSIDTLTDSERPELLRAAAEIAAEKDSVIRRSMGIVVRHSPRLLQTCLGDSPMQFAEFSPDSKLVALVTPAKGTVRIWDVENGIPVSPLLDFERAGPVFRTRFSPDGSLLLVVGRDGMSASRLALFSVPDGNRIVSDKAVGGAVWSAEFSPDGQHLLTAVGVQSLFGGQSGEAVVRRVTDLEPDGAQIKHHSWLMCATFSPDGTRIATASDDNVVRVWDANTGEAVTEPMIMDTPQQVVAFSSDGKRLVSAGNFGKARVWDAETGKPVTPVLSHGDINDSPTGPGGVAIAAACFGPNDHVVATVCGDKSARLWSAETGEALTAPMEHDDYIVSCEFQKSGGSLLLTGSLDGTARLWNPSTGQPANSKLRHLDRVYCARFSPTGNRIVTTSEDSTARIWEFDSGMPTVPRKNFQGTSLFSGDGRFVIEIDKAGVVQLLNSGSLDPIGKPLAVPHPVRTAAFSTAHDSSVVLLSNLVEAGQATIWNWETGEQIGGELNLPGSITHTSISSDGRWMALAGSATGPFVNVWDANKQKWILEARNSVTGFQHVSFGNERIPRLAASGLDGNAYLWNLERPADPPMQLNHGGLPVNSAQFSTDGAWIVTASANDMATVWDTATGQKVSDLKHSDTVTGAVFSPIEGDLRILTWSEDRTARLWKRETSAEKNEWTDSDVVLHHNGEVTDAAFSTDGIMIATASTDGTARIWDASSGSAISPAFRHIYAGVGMTPSVRQVRFVPDGSRLLSQSSLHTWIWELPIAEGRPDRLVKLAEWTAGRRYSAAGDFVPITTGDINEYLSLLIEADPNNYPARQWRARRAQEDGDSETALTEFAAAFKTESSRSDGQLWYEYGSALRDNKQYKPAWDAVSRAIELGHDFRGEASGTRAHIAINLNRFQQAVDDADVAMTKAPFPVVFKFPRAVALASLGRWDEAAKDFDDSFRATGAFVPVQPGFRYQRAVLELARSKTDRFRELASAMLTEMQQRIEDDSAFFGAWVCVPVPDAVDSDAMAAAVELAKKAVADQPQEPDRICALGAIMLRRGEAVEAKTLLRSAIDLHDRLVKQGKKSSLGEPYGQLYLALTLIDLGDADEAESLMMEAVNRIKVLKANEQQESLMEIFPWHREVVCNVLLAEVKSRLGKH